MKAKEFFVLFFVTILKLQLSNSFKWSLMCRIVKGKIFHSAAPYKVHFFQWYLYQTEIVANSLMQEIVYITCEEIFRCLFNSKKIENLTCNFINLQLLRHTCKTFAVHGSRFTAQLLRCFPLHRCSQEIANILKFLVKLLKFYHQNPPERLTWVTDSRPIKPIHTHPHLPSKSPCGWKTSKALKKLDLNFNVGSLSVVLFVMNEFKLRSGVFNVLIYLLAAFRVRCENEFLKSSERNKANNPFPPNKQVLFAKNSLKFLMPGSLWELWIMFWLNCLIPF